MQAAGEPLVTVWYPSHFVEHLARLLTGERLDNTTLAGGERSQGTPGEIDTERQQQAS